jgi:hypothetical protein
MGLPPIAEMLGHSQAQTTQRYTHLASDPVKAAAAAALPEPTGARMLSGKYPSPFAKRKAWECLPSKSVFDRESRQKTPANRQLDDGVGKRVAQFLRASFKNCETGALAANGLPRRVRWWAMTSSALDAARDYHRRGWRVVTIPLGCKGPVMPQLAGFRGDTQGFTAAIRRQRDVGVVVGPKSDELADVICANSSQAKGRVERAHKTLQDRLVKEMRRPGGGHSG